MSDKSEAEVWLSEWADGDDGMQTAYDQLKELLGVPTA